MNITENQLSDINEERRGKKYVDEKAAEIENGNVYKKDLKESPFVRYLQYGSNLEGYFTYKDMVL
jgi:hypothetical protein